MKDATDEIDERLANLDSYIEKSKTKKTKPKSKSEKIAERLKQEHDKPIEVKTKQNNKVDVKDKDEAKVIEAIRKASIVKVDIRPQISQLMFVKANNVVNIEQLKEEMLDIGIKVIEYTDVLPTMFNLHYNKEK